MVPTMSTSGGPYMSVLRIWAAVAWADGVVAPAEAEALRRLIAAAPVSPAEREIALAWLSSPVELDTGQVSAMSREGKRGVYQAAARLTRVDLEVAAEERALLERLREALGIDEVTAREIEAGITG
jgi:uncharacterized membrane protein YebE (DUF533 family)